MGRKLTGNFTVVEVALGMMRVSEFAQRYLREPRVVYLLSIFDLEQIGIPVVNERDGVFWIIDGQHRVEAIKRWLGSGWETVTVACRLYRGMTVRQEAEMFLRLNNQLTVSAFDNFKVSVTAGSPSECAVKAIVESVGMKIGKSKTPGTVGAVTTLVRIYDRAGGAILQRALRIAYESYGDPGINDRVIDGVARVCERYNIDDAVAIDRLRSFRGGVGALLQRVEILHKQVGAQYSQCTPAAIVDTLNSKRGGHKLPSWWK